MRGRVFALPGGPRCREPSLAVSALRASIANATYGSRAEKSNILGRGGFKLMTCLRV